jgi:hypothetical protein
VGQPETPQPISHQNVVEVLAMAARPARKRPKNLTFVIFVP